MQYCIYLRKSRNDIEAEERGELETLLRHEKILLELSKKQRLNVIKIHREVVSGETIASRPVMQQLLNEIEQNQWDGVLVMEVERLARGDTIDQGVMAQSFKFSDTKIITPMKTYDPNNEFDEEYFEFGLFMSRREYKAINRRLQRGRLSSIKDGKYVANQPPYGYLRKKLEKEKGYTLEPHPEQSSVVKLIFDLYAIGEMQEDNTYKRLGPALISRRLNALSIPTQKGGPWVSASIRGMLTNPVYIGKLRWNYRPANKKMVDGIKVIERPKVKDYIMVDGLHPPIVDTDIFSQTQQFFALNPPKPIGEQREMKNPLSGIVVCGKCGKKMTRRPYPEGSSTPDTLLCSANTCDNISSAIHYVEQRILTSLKQWLIEYKLQINDTDTTKTHHSIDFKKKTLKKMDDTFLNLTKQLDNIYDLLEQGVYTTQVFLERSNALTQKINALESDKSLLELDLQKELEREHNQATLIPKIENLLEVYDTLTSAKAKNKLLREVIEKAIYIKLTNGRWHNTPDNFEITIYPTVPLHD